MKALVFALACFIVATSALPKKGGFCHDDSGCHENQCCFGKVCHNKVAEGGRCIFRELICGCMPGLTCQKTAFVTMRCLPPKVYTTNEPSTVKPSTQKSATTQQ